MNRLVRDYVQFWRKEADNVLEHRTLTLYEQDVWESVQLIGSSVDEDRYSSGMIMEALGGQPSKLWFDKRIRELETEGFIRVKR